MSKVGAAEDSVTSRSSSSRVTLSAPDLLKKVKADPAVELASLNYKRHATAVPNDEFYGTDQEAYLNTVRVPQAWDLSKSTGSQIVAVLDTGVDAGHPDLVGHLVAGYNATSPNRGPIDDNGHGTHDARHHRGRPRTTAIGVAGVGWNAKVDAGQGARRRRQRVRRRHRRGHRLGRRPRRQGDQHVARRSGRQPDPAPRSARTRSTRASSWSRPPATTAVPTPQYPASYPEVDRRRARPTRPAR